MTTIENHINNKRSGKPATMDVATDRSSANERHLLDTVASASAITTPSVPAAGIGAGAGAERGAKSGVRTEKVSQPSIWSDPAMVVGVAMFVGKICRQTSLPFPTTLLALLHRHAEQHDLACKLTIVWLKKSAVIANLLPPYGVKDQNDA